MNNVLSQAELKARAYAMSREKNMKIGHAYETIAQSLGFKTYAALRAAMKDKK